MGNVKTILKLICFHLVLIYPIVNAAHLEIDYLNPAVEERKKITVHKNAMKNGQSLCKRFPHSEKKNDGKSVVKENGWKMFNRVFYELKASLKRVTMKTDSIAKALNAIYLNKIVEMTSRTIWIVTIQ